MTYPEQLLPQLIFKKITDDLTGHFICRKVLDKTFLEKPQPIVFEELLGIVKASDCFDYSTNLPGVFELEHNKIDFDGDKKAYFRAYWDEVSEVEIPVFEKDFVINQNVGWFFLQIDKINGLTIPFNRKADNLSIETATAVVLHTPNNSNFWHFSIRWKDANDYININKSAWKHNIIATVRALLSELILLTYPGQVIQEEFYKKN